MSRIEITVGPADVRIEGIDSTTASGDTFAHYQPVALMDATCAALLAINTPQAVAWAHEMYGLTAARAEARTTTTTEERK